MSRTMTVTEALVQLKLAKKKIVDKTQRIPVAVVVQKQLPPAGFVSAEAFVKSATEQLQAVTDLIRNADSIKRAVVASNAKTRVKIGTSEMTVAEAIDHKKRIELDKALLAHLERNYFSNENQYKQLQAKTEVDADNLLKQRAEGANQSALAEMRSTLIDASKPTLVVAEKVRETIEQLRTEIEDFEANVDTALSVSNATTVIEVA